MFSKELNKPKKRIISNMKTIKQMTLKWDRVSVVRDGGAEYSKQIKKSTDLSELLNLLLRDEVNEVLIAIHLNIKNAVVGYHEVSRGGVSGASATPADIFRPALLSGASRIILSHNHPSGDPKPSAEDIAFTSRVKNAGDLLGIQLLDHIIVGEHEYFSFTDHDLM